MKLLKLNVVQQMVLLVLMEMVKSQQVNYQVMLTMFLKDITLMKLILLKSI